MPRRKGIVKSRDTALEKALARRQSRIAAARKLEVEEREARNRDMYMLYHACGYTQEEIAAIANQALTPDDPSWVTDDTVQKALARMG